MTKMLMTWAKSSPFQKRKFKLKNQKPFAGLTCQVIFIQWFTVNLYLGYGTLVSARESFQDTIEGTHLTRDISNDDSEICFKNHHTEQRGSLIYFILPRDYIFVRYSWRNFHKAPRWLPKIRTKKKSCCSKQWSRQNWDWPNRWQ